LTDENDDDADIKKAFIKVKNMFIIPKDPDQTNLKKIAESDK